VVAEVVEDVVMFWVVVESVLLVVLNVRLVVVVRLLVEVRLIVLVDDVCVDDAKDAVEE